MDIRKIFVAVASTAVVAGQAAVAGSFAPAVDCSVTPDAPECAVVTAAPVETSTGLGTAGYIAGGVLGAAALAAILSDDDDDDDDSDTTTGSED